MVAFIIILFVLVFSIVYWAKFWQKEDPQAENAETSSLLHQEGFYDTDYGVFVGKNKKPIPGLEEVYYDRNITGRGIRYVPCFIGHIKQMSGRMFVTLTPYKVFNRYEVSYVGDFGIILHNDEFGEVFLGDFQSIPKDVKVGDCFNVSIIPEKSAHLWHVDFNVDFDKTL